ncbi:non-hydrolyzing UDP-N-acetylglucosamine 2-epimerase [Balneola sp. MJW-20]|uniref:non-hydrolyzing UDP-N-acetylglucosamine 2-epimerase n=1 Tax=Gracilimonas aurantiaca TaxID=3234185 RepID=UPI003465399A
MSKTKLLFVIGTRPEAIKLAPVIRALRFHSDYFETRICATAQHREMLDQVMNFFDLRADFDLDLMVPGQDLFGLTNRILRGLQSVIPKIKPDWVVVQGDTTTSFAASLAAFYSKVPVAHVEAGLRTFDKSSPYPEEMNRQLISRIADLHFAPTENNRENLVKENIDERKIYVTGNTVIDALLHCRDKADHSHSTGMRHLREILDDDKKLILITGHRRENFGRGFEQICDALYRLAMRDDIQIIYPVHLNPNVQQPVFDRLGDVENIHLIEPLDYPSFVWLMDKSHLVLTDSGGIQEEAPSLGKPVIVMREITERTEAVEAGTVLLAGTDTEKIVSETTKLLDDDDLYQAMSKRVNPYGDGNASDKIVKAFREISIV